MTIYNQLNNGLTLLQVNPDVAAKLCGSEHHSWLFTKESEEAPWLPLRKMNSLEVMQAEDQRDYGIVLNGDHQAINCVKEKGKPECPNKLKNWVWNTIIKLARSLQVLVV
jgi:hypothetical protein